MNESTILALVTSAMQFGVAGFALRLNRKYGTARVGWSLFGAFVLLALLRVMESSETLSSSTSMALKINGVYGLISFLMLLGLVHLEGVLKERLRVERLEQKMRADLEAEVKLKTQHLTRAIDELMQQMEETKRMSAILQGRNWEEDSTVLLDKRFASFGLAGDI